MFLGKNESCLMTALSGAFNKPVFDGNTILLEVKEENDKNRCLYIGGNMVCPFLTNDKLYKNVSSMGDNLIPHSIAIGEEKIYFLTPDFECIERKNTKILNRWKEMKFSLICLFIMIQIVEKTRLKNYDHLKFIQIKIIKYKYCFYYINGNNKRHIKFL